MQWLPVPPVGAAARTRHSLRAAVGAAAAAAAASWTCDNHFMASRLAALLAVSSSPMHEIRLGLNQAASVPLVQRTSHSRMRTGIVPRFLIRPRSGLH